MKDAGWPAGTEDLLEEILNDAHGDDEQLWALRQFFEDRVPLPADAFVIGEAVRVLLIDYDGNTRRGLMARCRRRGGGDHSVPASELVFPEGTQGARYVAAYRKWLGIDPAAPSPPASVRPPRRQKAGELDVDLDRPVELVVLAPKESAARCRVLGTEGEITLRSAGAGQLVPGEIVTVRARKQWRWARHPYLSGDVEGHRLEVAALGLAPLRLRDPSPWDPSEQYWGEEGDPIEDWARSIIAKGPRIAYEMEQLLPGWDPNDWDHDPILEASERQRAGDLAGAHVALVDMLTADLRCLDAHAHLGNFSFDHLPKVALRHYEVGVRIGELSLGPEFDGLLPWGRTDNRPFLRCLHGFGLSLWRLGRGDEAGTIFERLLLLNPSDNQGIRFLLPQVRSGQSWEDQRSDE